MSSWERKSPFQEFAEAVKTEALASEQVRPYQKDAINYLTSPSKFGPDRKNVELVCLPVGTGKTFVAVLAAYVLAPKRILVVTPSQQISFQFKDAFEGGIAMNGKEEKLSELEKRGIVPREKFVHVRPNSFVALSTAMTLPQNFQDSYCAILNAHKFRKGKEKLETIPKDMFDLVIVDEAHHYPAKTWDEIIKYFSEKAKVLFLTASKKKGDGTFILQHLERKDDSPHSHFEFSHQEAVERGYIRNVTLKTLSSENYERVLLDNIKRELKSKEKSFCPKGMVIFHKKEQATTFSNKDTSIISYTGNDSRGKLTSFTDSHTPKILAVCMRLIEGFDHSEICVLGICRPCKSSVLLSQFVGRAVRKHPSDGDIEGTVFISEEYVDAIKIFNSFFIDNVIPDEIFEDDEEEE